MKRAVTLKENYEFRRLYQKGRLPPWAEGWCLLPEKPAGAQPPGRDGIRSSWVMRWSATGPPPPAGGLPAQFRTAPPGVRHDSGSQGTDPDCLPGRS